MSLLRGIIYQRHISKRLFHLIKIQPAFDPPGKSGVARRLIAALLVDAHGMVCLFEVVVIKVESLSEAKSGIHHKGTDKTGRQVSLLFQQFRQSVISFAQFAIGVVEHAMIRGNCTCQHRTMRRQRIG